MSKYPKHANINPKRLTDKAHLRAVAQLPCCCCGADRSDMDSTPHHVLRGVVRGFGLKAGDDLVVPMCTKDHNALHKCGDETGFLASHGIVDAVGLAKALYETSGDHGAMLAALAEYRI